MFDPRYPRYPRHRRHRRRLTRRHGTEPIVLGTLALTLTVLLGGCASYAVPGRGADMGTFGLTEEERRDRTSVSIQSALDRQPAARFPAAMAIVRVQAPGYSSHTAHGHGRGRYSVLTTRDIETDQHLERLARLPMVQGVAPVNRLLLSDKLQSDREVRHAAARRDAELTLVYTIDTRIHVGDVSSPLDTITLGFLPHKKAHVTTTASAVLLDTRTGYVYAVTEHAARHNQWANTWTTEAAVEQSRLKTERDAFDGLVTEFEGVWPSVVNRYALGGKPGIRNMKYETSTKHE